VRVWWVTADHLWLEIVDGLAGVLCIPCLDDEMQAVGTPVLWEARRAG
jgi:hypothetical protein